ncbi:peptidylprolyl isomerase [Psychroflexus montanilacus]|uniref:peptidylprolyl isomerase n=1 Tax=Psychroflexus montanilacus TaxID=2873598 RepID=UPI001CCC183D|nr:peptidylprolyl isomerase [Psychroflexus montanilacus]MBZ9651223.1 peptidylprolyl isomerase [Psychroflexus montanilacus]
MKLPNLFLVASSILMTIGCSSKYAELEDGLYAEFKTSKGDFVAQLHYEDIPMTVGNFVALAEGVHPMTEKRYSDKPLYDSLIFHRVIKDFIIQGGDPRGTGQGGPGFKFPDETDGNYTHDDKGVLSMANSDGQDTKAPFGNSGETNGSQFFITLRATPHLDGLHTVFGKVVKNQEVVDAIGEVETGGRDRPVDKVYIEKVNIIRKGSAAENFDAVEAFKSGMDAHQSKLKKEAEEREAILKELSEGFVETESGLRYKIEKSIKNGVSPKPGDIVKVHYNGFLTDNTKFDSSYDRGEPIEFELGAGRVIPGWDEGLQLLKGGEKARFIIPPHLSYNERAAGPIPPYSILIFDVELVEVNKK